MSPLGKYSQSVAAVVAVLVVASAIAMRFLGEGDPWLESLAALALGAIFGASAATAVNGQAINAAHRRLDLISAPPGQALQDHPEDQGAVDGAHIAERYETRAP